MSTFPSQKWGPNLTWTMQALWMSLRSVRVCMSYMMTYNHVWKTGACNYVWKTLSSSRRLSPLAFKCFPHPPQHSSLGPEGRSLMKTFYLSLNVSRFPGPCLLSSYGSLCWVAATVRGTSRMMSEPGSRLCCPSLVWLMEGPGRKSALVVLKPKRYEKGLVCVGAESIPNKDKNKWEAVGHQKGPTNALLCTTMNCPHGHELTDFMYSKIMPN